MSKKIDVDQIYKLACIQCSDEEIAQVTGCAVSVIKNKFKNIVKKGRETGKKSLRRAMWDKALNGDTRAQIFLSKNVLGFKDNPEDQSHKNPLPWNDDND